MHQVVRGRAIWGWGYYFPKLFEYDHSLITSTQIFIMFWLRSEWRSREYMGLYEWQLLSQPVSSVQQPYFQHGRLQQHRHRPAPPRTGWSQAQDKAMGGGLAPSQTGQMCLLFYGPREMSDSFFEAAIEVVSERFMPSFVVENRVWHCFAYWCHYLTWHLKLLSAAVMMYFHLHIMNTTFTNFEQPEVKS